MEPIPAHVFQVRNRHCDDRFGTLSKATHTLTPLLRMRRLEALLKTVIAEGNSPSADLKEALRRAQGYFIGSKWLETNKLHNGFF